MYVMFVCMYEEYKKSAGPFGATRLLGLDVDLCALLTDPVMLFLRSDQSLLYCSLGLLRSRYLKV